VDTSKGHVHIAQNPYAWLLAMYRWPANMVSHDIMRGQGEHRPVFMDKNPSWRQWCDFSCFLRQDYQRHRAIEGDHLDPSGRSQSIVHLRKETLHAHLRVADAVPHYAFLRYEDLVSSDGAENDSVLSRIGLDLGVGGKLAPRRDVPYYTQSKPKKVWLPWKNLLGFSASVMPIERHQFRMQGQFMCAYRDQDLEMINGILTEAAHYLYVLSVSDLSLLYIVTG
jgi:hypothetical protein